ncbi:MAG: response regulator transcription factor [Prevotella sp.]|nr:response regulator transcription factor [Prevotella sp.]
MIENIELADLRIAVIDDHNLVLEGVRSLLARNGMMQVELFRSAAALTDVLRTRPYDIYIVDVELPDMDGFLLIDAIREVWPKARIIVSTIHDELWTVRKLVARNVDGIVYKSLDMSLVVDAIHDVLSGERYYCGEVQEALRIMDNGIDHPSQREMEVLNAIANGYTSKEIAARLFISENTVEAHRKSLFTKLEARNIADLVMKAIKRGYIN